MDTPTQFAGDTSEADPLVPPFQGDTSEADPLPQVKRFTSFTPPAKTDSPNLDLVKAQKILKFYEDQPQWLAHPFTQHAATADLANAGRIITGHIAIRKANTEAEIAIARNSTGTKVGNSLLKLAEGGGDGAKWGAQWYALGDDGKPLYENPKNWEAIISGYETNATKQVGTEPMSMKLEDGTVIQGWKNLKTGHFTTDPAYAIGARLDSSKQLLEEKFKQQLALIDPKNKAAIERMTERYKLALELFETELPQKTAAAKELIGASAEAAIELSGTHEQNAEKLAAFKKSIGSDKPDRPVTVTETDPVTGTKISRRMTLADAQQLPAATDTATHRLFSEYAAEKSALESGDQSVGPDWIHLSNRARNLAELKTKIEQKGINADTGRRLGGPTASTNAPAASAPAAASATNEVIKLAPNGKRAVFDADTKKFLRYAD